MLVSNSTVIYVNYNCTHRAANQSCNWFYTFIEAWQ